MMVFTRRAQVMGMAGVTLGAVTQSLATLIGGWIVGFVYGWKLAFVGLCEHAEFCTIGGH